jgi:hypothetical protein
MYILMLLVSIRCIFLVRLERSHFLFDFHGIEMENFIACATNISGDAFDCHVFSEAVALGV